MAMLELDPISLAIGRPKRSLLVVSGQPVRPDDAEWLRRSTACDFVSTIEVKGSKLPTNRLSNPDVVVAISSASGHPATKAARSAYPDATFVAIPHHKAKAIGSLRAAGFTPAPLKGFDLPPAATPVAEEVVLPPHPERLRRSVAGGASPTVWVFEPAEATTAPVPAPETLRPAIKQADEEVKEMRTPVVDATMSPLAALRARLPKLTLSDLAWLRQQPDMAVFRSLSWSGTATHMRGGGARVAERGVSAVALLAAARAAVQGGAATMEHEFTACRLRMVKTMADKLANYSLPRTSLAAAHSVEGLLVALSTEERPYFVGVLHEAIYLAELPWGRKGRGKITRGWLRGVYAGVVATETGVTPPTSIRSCAMRKGPWGIILRKLGVDVALGDLAWLRQQPEFKALRGTSWVEVKSVTVNCGRAFTDDALYSAAADARADAGAPESPAVVLRFDLVARLSAAIKAAGGFWTYDALRSAESRGLGRVSAPPEQRNALSGVLSEAAAFSGCTPKSRRKGDFAAMLVAVYNEAISAAGAKLQEEPVRATSPPPTPAPTPTSPPRLPPPIPFAALIPIPIQIPRGVAPPAVPGALPEAVVDAARALKVAMDANNVRRVVVGPDGVDAELITTVKVAW